MEDFISTLFQDWVPSQMLDGFDTLLSGSVVAAAARWTDAFRGARGCFFTFHRAAPRAVWSSLPNRNFYLDLDFLDALLTHLATSGRRIVTIEQGLGLAADTTTRDTFVNFSIDDCYRDTYEEVVPLFRRHGVPLTLFVTTGIPDGTMSLCWAGLEDTIRHRDHILVDGEEIETDTIERKLATYAALQAQWDGPAMDEHYATFCARNGVDPLEMREKHAITWQMLSELAQDPLVEIGSHTVSHPRISELTLEDARYELSGSRERLREKLAVPVKHFAFPYGRMKDCGPRDFAIAQAVGYEGVATTTKGLIRPGPVPYAYPRVTLNGAYRTLLVPELHMAGASAAAARALGRV
jgi:peptidoglycan/xylan/chitin deacetylase (PgdA/CDA1 family)